MNVVVFDVDGTLTLTNQVDGTHFRGAVRTVLPSADIHSFSGFTELTDAAILRELHARYSTRDYDAVEAEVQSRFLAALEDATRSEPEAFRPVRGARRIFEAVRREGWIPAIATGGWRPSAILKLSAAEVSFDGIPMATASDEIRRVDIIRKARSLATAGAVPSQVVYVGDGPWDVRACAELQIGFIGVLAEGEDRGLRQLGAQAVLTDYGDPDSLLQLLVDPDRLVPSESS